MHETRVELNAIELGIGCVHDRRSGRLCQKSLIAWKDLCCRCGRSNRDDDLAQQDHSDDFL